LLRLAMVCALSCVLFAQTLTERELDLRRAEVAEAQARALLEQVRHLHEQGVESRYALDKAQADYDRAVIETVRARTAVSNELPAVRIVSAVKSQNASGRVVTLGVQEMGRSYDSRMERQYLVSLMSEGRIISDPYQALLTTRGVRASAATLRFKLLADVDTVTVLITAGSRRDEIPVLLQRGIALNQLQLAASVYSQEGALGEQVDYSVDIERYSNQAEEVSLVAEGLPPDFVQELIEPDSKAKINSVRFRTDSNRLKVIFRVSIPDQADPVWFRKLLAFKLVAKSPGASQRWGEVNLQLRPVGSPKLALSSGGNLLVQIAPGEVERVRVLIENTGGADARGVTLEGDFPLGLSGEFVPPSIPVLRPHERKPMDIVLSSTPEAITGDYSLKLRATTASRIVASDSTEMTYRIELRDARWGILMTAGVVVVLGLLTATVIWLRRSFRR
jgi:hypothetical protein